jgi:hypothetical protein
MRRLAVLSFTFTFFVAVPLLHAGAREQAHDAAVAAAPLLTIELSGSTETIRGVTPGGSVALFGATWELTARRPQVRHLVRRESVVTDEDRDGLVTVNLNQTVPELGIWVAVDVSTGAHAEMTTPGFNAERVNFDEALKSDNNGQLKKIELPLSEVEMLLVRPGEGAWRAYGSKASAVDENRDNGRPFRLDIASFRPMGASTEAPKSFRKGDVIAVIETLRAKFGVMEVNP